MTNDNKKYNNKYRIQSARAMWHDYNGGIYFVTICTKNMEYYFGEIRMDETELQMRLTEIGRYADENLQQISMHYPYAEIPLFVVMPNHIHLVVIIDNVEPLRATDETRTHNVEPLRATAQSRATALLSRATNTVEPLRATALQTEPTNAMPEKNETMANISPKHGQLSTVIRGFKSAITRFARQNYIDFAWQPRFYDRIVRNQDELNAIAQYIENNVAKWYEDKRKNN